MTTNLIIQKLKIGERLTAQQIREFFRKREEWDEDYSLPLARRALEIGENFLAYDIAEHISNDTLIGKIHVMALALARSGALKRASDLVAQLPDNDDSEVVGLKSRILKDLATRSTDVEKQKEYYERAGHLSLEIFNRKHQYYNGINAASCLLMAGHEAEARQLVREQVLPVCCAEDLHDLWWHATMGECHLLLKEYSLAGKYYHDAVQMAISEGKFGNLTSTLKQLHLLAKHFDKTAIEKLLEQMALPSVAVFSGHMMDRPGRKVPRFPAYAEEQVRSELAAVIRKHRIHIAFVSCACGGDILFAEEVLKYGGECFMFPSLPMESEIRNSVDFIPGSNWKERLEALLLNDNTTLIPPECDVIEDESDAIVYDFNNRYMLGSAISKSKELLLPLVGVAVWNREKSGLTGGTDSAVERWLASGLSVEIVTPEVKK